MKNHFQTNANFPVFAIRTIGGQAVSVFIKLDAAVLYLYRVRDSLLIFDGIDDDLAVLQPIKILVVPSTLNIG